MKEHLKEISTFEELAQELKSSQSRKSDGFSPSNLALNLEMVFPLSKPNGYNSISINLAQKTQFNNCHFYEFVSIHSVTNHRSLTFEDCHFYSTITLKTTDDELSFYNCTFWEESVFIMNKGNFKGRMRFKNCKFKGVTEIANNTFKDYIDFWNSTFYKPLSFYKTDFLGHIYMPAVTFKEDVLFTYSLIDSTAIFRGAVFEKGLDLSLAIINGEINTFQMKIGNFKCVPFNSEDDYNTSLNAIHEIPYSNNRETFRILKQSNIKGSNIIESLRFKKLEKLSLFEEVKKKKWSWEKLGDYLILFFNKWSNNYGTSISRSFGFTFLTGFLFFLLSVVSTRNYELTINFLEWDLEFGFKYFTQFLIPTHKFSYMDSMVETDKWFYVFDFIGRTFVGYGIYQFITAFRKYR